MINFLFNFETFLYSYVILACSIKLIGSSKFYNEKINEDSWISVILFFFFIFFPAMLLPTIVIYELISNLKDWATEEKQYPQQSKSSSNIPFTQKDCEKLSNAKKLDKLIEHFKSTSYSWTAFDNTSSALRRMKEKLTEVEQKYPRIQSTVDKLAEVALNYTITLTLDDALELYREGKPNRDALSSIVDVLNKANGSITDLITSEVFRIEKEKKELADISMKQYNEVKESVFKTMEVFVSKKGE